MGDLRAAAAGRTTTMALIFSAGEHRTPARRPVGTPSRPSGSNHEPRRALDLARRREDPAPGAVVRPDERLTWPRTFGLGAQHVVAMFGASFVAPVLMGLDPNLAIMMSGVATAIFLLATKGRVPSYLGCSLSFVGVAATIRASGGDSATVTGAVLVVGAALFLVGLAVQRFGARIIHAAMPPVVTGRGGDADRLQPGAGDRLDVLAAGPVDGAGRHAVHRARRGVPARLPLPDRDLPGAGLRVRAVLGAGPGLREDPLPGRRGGGRRPLAPGPLGRRPGRLDRAAVLPRARLRVVGDPGGAALW